MVLPSTVRSHDRAEAVLPGAASSAFLPGRTGDHDMTRSTDIEQERDQLEKMIRLLGLEVEGGPVKRERPDFLITLRGRRTVGIELVRAFDEYIAAGRGARARINRALHDRLAKAGINAGVNVGLDDDTAAALNGDRNALDREVKAIFELVHRTMSDETESRRYDFERIDLQGTGVERADAVRIYRRDEPLVTWSGLGDGQSSNVVQDAINGKAGDLPVYRQCGANEIWLLVIGSAGTGGALFIDDVDDVVFTSPYDKTIFLELFEERCTVLNTKMDSTPNEA